MTLAPDFDSLYAEHAPRVLALCHRLMGDRARAHEVLQSTFIRAWERLHLFEPGTNFGAWIHRIAVNTALNELRRQQRWERDLDITDLQLAAPSTALASADLREALDRAIADLPPRSRAAFTLHDVEGFDAAEIAEMMGISAATVRVHLFKARRALRACLAL